MSPRVSYRLSLASLFIASIVAGVIIPWADVYPEAAKLPLADWLGGFMNWLVRDLTFGVVTFRELTRAFAWVMQWPMTILNDVLWEGIEFTKDFTMAPLSWLGVICAASLWGYAIGGWRIGLLNAVCFAYLAAFGMWSSAMMTMASVLVAVLLGYLLGLLIGVAACKNKHIERGVTVVLDFMQTVPVFAYLIPVLLLFGFSAVSAMLATMIYATPAMVRCTILGLRSVPDEIVEYGRMSGATDRQLTWKILVPSAKATLLVGLNQVIILSLNAVIIASLIGAGGLGFDVLGALRTMRIGQALEAGVAIVLIAIVLDRNSQELAKEKLRSLWHRGAGYSASQKIMLTGLVVLVVTSLLANWIDWLAVYPEGYRLSTGNTVSGMIDYITINYFEQIESISAFLYIYVLIPTRTAITSIPWIVTVTSVFVLGCLVRGPRLGLQLGGLALFVVVTGHYDKGMTTVYLIGIAVVSSLIIGIPLGVCGALNDRISRALKVLCDTLQTLPAFVYLVPVVMLFRVGDIPAILAVVLYAVAPAIRYTDAGLRRIDPSLIEAATAMGCFHRQIMLRIRIPLALPTVLLGINQTIMLAISMLVVTALIGTEDLGQVVYEALSKADPGVGITAGASIAFIAMIADRLINASAENKKARLGMA